MARSVMTQAINIAHDQQRPFCLISRCAGFWFVIPNYVDRLEEIDYLSVE